VAEGARLESVYTSNRIGGSNPFLSARFCGGTYRRDSIQTIPGTWYTVLFQKDQQITLLYKYPYQNILTHNP